MQSSSRASRPRIFMTSWVPGADDSEFPVQNLPFGIFSHAPSGRDPRIGVAIGDSVLDLKALLAEGLLDGCACAPAFDDATLNAFMARPRADWLDVRKRLAALLSRGGSDSALSSSKELQSRCLVPRSEVAMHLPCTIGDYTDFYSSREHATNVGTMFRGKDNALQPNWLHLPVGYHGRASSVVPSGTPVVRPKGQLQLDKTDPTKGTEHAPCRLLDFELEMGFFVGGPANALGSPLTMETAKERIFGFVLCNDWSARDIQKFEYVPLGPFGAKNFATSISPWIVMSEALEPFRCETSAGSQTAPVPLEYLRDPDYSSYDVALEVALTPPGGQTPTVISRSNYKNMYWTCTQQLVHHAVTGCDMRPGDLLASGTISGTDPTSYGSLLELTWQGTKEVGPLCDESVRKFLRDGDTVTMRGTCTHPNGYRIGFGEVSGTVLPAGTLPAPSPAPPPAVALNDVSLHSYWRSSCSWRVRIALAFHGVPYAYVATNLLEGAQHSISAMGQVPRLDWSDTAGERHSLTQSLPIIEFLEDALCSGGAHGGVTLLPSDPIARSRAREIAEVINAGTQPLQNLSHLKALTSVHHEGAEGARALIRDVITKGLGAAERLAAKNRDPRFCVGSRTSIADLCVIPQLYSARRFDVDMTLFPRLCTVEKHAETLKYFQEAIPDAQPDAQPYPVK